MKPLAFLRSDPVRRLVRRAARAASAPVAIHYRRDHEEGPKAIVGSGQCAACAAVATIPGGVQACRASRNQSAATALAQNVVMPFVCHMGFACFSARALPPSSDREGGYCLTIGPIAPVAGAPSIPHDAAAGLARLESPRDDEAVAALVEDIALREPDSVSEIAAWTSEALVELWTQQQESLGLPVEAPTGYDAVSPPVGRSGRVTIIEPHNARTIATALAGGQMAQSRQLVAAVLDEIAAPKRRAIFIRRARAAGLAMAIIEAAESAGMNTREAWGNLPALLATLEKTAEQRAMTEAILDALGVLRRKQAQGSLREQGLDALTRIVTENMEKGVLLKDVARQLGEQPSAITHRLQRKFGMSFTEFVGRLRVDRAKELLRRTQLSIRDVALRVGLGDPSNLGRLFRRHEGISPTEYRKRYGARS